MLSDNLKSLRKARGLTQESLAVQLHVTRQTISKWENSLSVPDAEQLVQIAKIFGVNVSELLGKPVNAEGKSDALSSELARINEQLAIKNNRSRKLVKTLLILIAVIAIISCLILLFNYLPIE
ncbi:MAG: helix-turn-helix domain-containing protein [Lachnospiraceae bacterium]